MLTKTFKIFLGSRKKAEKSPEISLRPLQKSDFPSLCKWLAAPHVQQWWRDPSDIESVNAKYTPCLNENSPHPVRVYIIEVSNQSVGMIQCYRHSDHPNWNRLIGIDHAAGIDFFIGASNQIGKGIGSKAIQQITKIAFDLYPEIETVIAVPQKNNKRSCRALKKAGFTCLQECMLDLDHPSNLGVSRIYAFKR